MISDAFIIYLIGMLIILVINMIGYSKMPFLCLVAMLSTMILTFPTIDNFGDYWMIAFVLVLTNFSIGFFGITSALR